MLPLHQLMAELPPAHIGAVLDLLPRVDDAAAGITLDAEAQTRAQMWALLPALMEHVRDSLLEHRPDALPMLLREAVASAKAGECPCPCRWLK